MLPDRVLGGAGSQVPTSERGDGGEPPLVVEPFEGGSEAWDALIHGREGATFCHLYGWRRVMEDALGHQTFYLLARHADGEARGALPLVRVRSRLFGDYLISMPFLNYGGPIGTPQARAALAQDAAERARVLGVDLLELRNRADLTADPLELNQRKLTVIKELPESSEDLWENGLRSKVRSQVRRPMKEGMEVRTGPDLLEPFYDVFSATMRDLGTPVLPKKFFEAVREHLAETVVFMTVEMDGRPLAAGCGLHWGGEFEITWAGASREHSKLAPNMLLYWGMMEEGVRLGMDRFNFGRCTPDSGTHRFKRQWGTDDYPLPWLQWSPSGILSPPDPDSPKYRTAISVWQRLPVGLTNMIGPPISRCLP